MLAINSDVEWTHWREQVELLREFGKRGLETAFSFWLYAVPKKIWRLYEDDGTPTPEAAAALQLARAGLFDSNHAIGGRLHQGRLNYNREDIRRGYEALAAAGVRPPIFTNHGTHEDRQNVAGAWAYYHEGDLPGSDVYHLDLTLALGARYFWCDPDFLMEDTALAPQLDAKRGLFVSGLGRDGNHYIRFRRFCGKLPPGGPSLCNLEQQLGIVLDADQPGYTVVYQHLGVERHPDGKSDSATLPPLRADAARGLDRLQALQDEGRILVTTTSRLLDHAALMTARPWRMSRRDNHVTVAFDDELKLAGVSWPLSWKGVEGWTIPADGLTGATARLRGEERALEKFEVAGRSYFGVPWSRIDMLAELERAGVPATKGQTAPRVAAG